MAADGFRVEAEEDGAEAAEVDLPAVEAVAAAADGEAIPVVVVDAAAEAQEEVAADVVVAARNLTKNVILVSRFLFQNSFSFVSHIYCSW